MQASHCGPAHLAPRSRTVSERRKHMRIGVSLAEPAGPRALALLGDQPRRAADDGFSSAWMAHIFGPDALTAVAVAGRQVAGIELGTARVPVRPRHPAALAHAA